MVGVGMIQFSLEEIIKWQSKTEQIKIQEIISGKNNFIDEGEGESVVLGITPEEGWLLALRRARANAIEKADVLPFVEVSPNSFLDIIRV
jgi:hypothetical protein